MEFFNGLGGFTNDGHEYLTFLEGNDRTPAPWLNVIANPSFGFQVSTDGSGFTWSVNSQQNQLTPWSNDPVCDGPGEAIYVRDEDTGEVWGPTALPIRDKTASYAARHGQGYSRFDHVSHGIALELLQFVPVDDSIKISRLKIANRSDRPRRLSITAYVEWVLGPNRSATAPYVVTEINPETGAIFAWNPWSEPFRDRVAFADLNGKQTAWTCDRTEFLGRDGAMDWPLALTSGAHLSNRTGAGLDPCGALQTRVTLDVAGTTEIVFFLGQSPGGAEAQSLLAKYRKADLDAVVRRGHPAMARHARGRAGQDARPRDGYSSQPLAALSDPGLPGMGAVSLLPGKRRLWLPRSIAGCDGAVRIAARNRAGAHPHRRRAAVR